MVHNTGETWLDQVEVDDQIAGCDLQTIAGTTDSTDKFMSPNEIWWYECTLANITDDVMNLATVDAVPTHEDKTPTEHAPINDTDPAFIHTTADPRIEIKKYVQDAADAPQWNINDPDTSGVDAQDAQKAVLIAYDGTAKYTIKVMNTGATWLDQVVVDDVKVDEPKTKTMIAKLAELNVSNALIVTVEDNRDIALSVRNIIGVDAISVSMINPVNLVAHDKVVMTSKAVEKVQEWLS